MIYNEDVLMIVCGIVNVLAYYYDYYHCFTEEEIWS